MGVHPGPDGAAEAASGDATRLRALLDIAKVVGAARRFDHLIELTAEEARRALDASSLSIARWDRERGVLRVLVNVGLLGPHEIRFPAGEVGGPARFPDAHALVEECRGYVASRDDGDEEAEALMRLGKDSALAIPILVEARVWGGLYATRAEGQPRFAAADLDFANAVATHVAAGVVQADHFARIERLAFQDPLTGLANRRAVDERLEAVMAEHASTGAPVSLVLADINQLKQVNDSFGHAAGDRLIVAVADAVRRASGGAPGSLAARIGGDEFCIVVAGPDPSDAVKVAEELCRLVDGKPMSTGVSCGVASTDTLPGPVETPTRLFRLADAAQYRAKRSGSRTPVVAGQATAEGPGEPPVDRRARRGRLAVPTAATLESGLELLDRLTGSDAQTRVEAVADHLLTTLDAAAWWVSRTEAGGRLLMAVSTSVRRVTDEPGNEEVARDEVGLALDLDAFPVADAALRAAGAFRVEPGQPGNDAAQEAALVSAGYTGVLGAGAAGRDGGWLVEIYTDSISLPTAGFEPLLRALLAVAVAGAGRPVRLPGQVDLLDPVGAIPKTADADLRDPSPGR